MMVYAEQKVNCFKIYASKSKVADFRSIRGLFLPPSSAPQNFVTTSNFTK